MRKKRKPTFLGRKLRLESLEDRNMLTPFVVMNANNDGGGSLRAAIVAANLSQNTKDEIIFDASLFNSGTPIISIITPLSVTDPVLLHSPHGDVRIQKALGGSAQEALTIVPNVNGTAEDFEIRDLIITNFKYGIRVNDSGGSATANAEGVNIIDNVFIDNERAIYLEDSLFPFEIRNNQIFGIPDTPEPNMPNEAGIWIETTSTQTNSFSPIIDNNIIVDNEDYGIIVVGAKIPNLAITGNRIGADGFGFAAPNGIGILVQGNGKLIGTISDGNEIVANGSGILIVFSDEVTIDGNLIAFNVGKGIELVNFSNDNIIETNSIIGNGGAGIVVGTDASDLSVRNRISSNYFEDNGSLPIDLLRNDVVDSNDTNDTDDGPNRRMNYPEILSSQIVDEGTRWRVPVEFDGFSPGTFQFEFYRHVPSTGLYELIRTEVRPVSAAGDWAETLYFERGTELNVGEHLAVLAIWDTTTGGTPVGDTSELVSTSGPMPDAPPRIVDVRLKGSGWTDADPLSYAEFVPIRKQLAPIYMDGVNQIEIQFSEHVNITEGSLTLLATGEQGVGEEGEIDSIDFDYNQNVHVATWTFPVLAGDKYRIDIAASGVTDAAGNALDGHWDNLTNNSPDDWMDDPIGRDFETGTGLGGSSFQFFFALLPGDYNQDGIVNDSDLSVVQDGDGDGDIDAADSSLVTMNDGARLPLRYANRGDYEDDEIIDGKDYGIWRIQYGQTVTPGTGADGNGDGVVNAADYLTWANWQHTVGAWNVPVAGLGSLLTIVNFENAPTVVNVTMSGSSSTHDPYSFDGVAGSGEQLRTVPVGGVDTISITFSEDL